MGRFTATAVRLAVTALGVALVAWALAADPHWAERHVLPAYCSTGVAGLATARALRWASAGLGVLAAVWLAPGLARHVARASLRPRAAPLVGIAVAVAASLGVTEVYMRGLRERVTAGGRPVEGARGVPMTRPDPRLGWSYFPGRTTLVQMGGRRIAYAIDGDGNRAASSDAAPDRARPTILFTGESIAFGYGLPYEETIPSIVGRDLGIQTANLAVVGYGTDQAFLRVADALPRYAHPLAVVSVFVPDQIRRNVDTWRPRLGLGPGGTLALVPPSTGPGIVKLLEQLPYRGDEALRVTAAVLRATAEAARSRGAQPLFVVTNYGPACLRQRGEEAWVVDELFARQGLPFVRVDLAPEDRLPVRFERHPSLRGTLKIAAAVERALAPRPASP